MSRIGRNPIDIPKEVKIQIKDATVFVEGKKGKLDYKLPAGISAEEKDNKICVKRDKDTKKLRASHGLARALISNMVQGVAEGFKKELEISGVGYKVQKKGKGISLQVGFSHNVDVPIWKGLNVECPSVTKIVVEGIDKCKVGEYAAWLYRIMPPEPYKGKGIRYTGQQIRRKVGKAMK